MLRGPPDVAPGLIERRGQMYSEGDVKLWTSNASFHSAAVFCQKR